tara:strand:+ start:450 stop:899 length:450 start_codon:yes stop_codon:yes gene_type:complete
MDTKKAFNNLHTVVYDFNEYYGLSFLTHDRYNKVSDSLSYLRSIKEINGEEYRIINNMFKHQYNNLFKIKEFIKQQPRRHAQLFIGKKKIRSFIFKRDNYKCLRCGSVDGLSLDHIKAINNGGENKLSNLQTLCKSCNSWKSTNYIDFR